jgi:hypothetical protein
LLIAVRADARAVCISGTVLPKSHNFPAMDSAGAIYILYQQNTEMSRAILTGAPAE